MISTSSKMREIPEILILTLLMCQGLVKLYLGQVYSEVHLAKTCH